MKQLLTLVALMCAVAFQAKAQTNVEQALQEAEKKAALADQNPTDGKLQYQAAFQFISDVLGDKRDPDRALTYANRALKIAQAQTELKDTLKGLTYYTLAYIYIQKKEYQNASDIAEMAIDAFQQELGRNDALTIGTKLIFGNFMIYGGQPFRGFPKVLESFIDNHMAPKDKRIENMDEANIMQEFAIERLIAEYTYYFRHVVPIITYEGKPYLIVQTPDWNMERPIVGWRVASIMRTEEEQATYQGDDIILFGNNEFKVIPFAEREKVNLTFQFVQYISDPRHLLTHEGEARLWFLTPESHQEILTKYREFKNKK